VMLSKGPGNVVGITVKRKGRTWVAAYQTPTPESITRPTVPYTDLVRTS
jgi:hypothetical protein